MKDYYDTDTEDFVDVDNPDSEILKDILKKYDIASKYWAPIHEDYLADVEFAYGDQWTETVRKERTDKNLSCLNYNQLPGKINYIVNNARSNDVAIKCNPVGEGANKNTAKVIDGIIKYIQYRSNYKATRTYALQCSVTGGIGASRVLLVKDNKGRTNPMIERIIDPTTVIVDPNSICSDFRDAEYMFITSWITKEQYEVDYPEYKDDMLPDTRKYTDLIKEDCIALLEYWCKNRETGLVEQYILNGNRIISHLDDYAGSMIPIIVTIGSEVFVNKSRKFAGIIRNIKDQQKLLNLSKSKTADYISSASTSPYVVSINQIKGFEAIWANANRNGAPYLPYNETPAGKPDRAMPIDPPSAYMQVSQEADADIRAAIGIKDPMQEVPITQSGKAIKLQINQGNIGTFGYIDNLNQSIKYTGEILVDLIPYIYNDVDIHEIMGVDGQISTVKINEPYEENGSVVLHDLKTGRYVVTIDDGPSFESRREEATENLLEIIKANPALMQVAGDVLFKTFNFDGASEIADRLRAQIPPQILAASNPTNGDSASQTQVLQNNVNMLNQQLQQLQMQNQQYQQILQQMQQEKQAKITEVQARGEVDANLKQLDQAHDIRLKQMDIDSKSQNIAQKGYVDLTLMHDKAIIEDTANVADNHNKIFHKQLDLDIDLHRGLLG